MQQVELARRQRHRRRRSCCTDARRRIEHHVLRAQAFLRLAVRAAHQRAQARGQLVQVDGLDDVVVGADIEPANAVGHRVASGQHQHRQADAGAANGGEHVHAVLQRQPQVEHRGRVAARRAARARPPHRRAPSRPGSRAGAGRPAARHRAAGRLRRAGCAWRSVVRATSIVVDRRMRRDRRRGWCAARCGACRLPLQPPEAEHRHQHDRGHAAPGAAHAVFRRHRACVPLIIAPTRFSRCSQLPETRRPRRERRRRPSIMLATASWSFLQPVTAQLVERGPARGGGDAARPSRATIAKAPAGLWPTWRSGLPRSRAPT